MTSLLIGQVLQCLEAFFSLFSFLAAERRRVAYQTSAAATSLEAAFVRPETLIHSPKAES